MSNISFRIYFVIAFSIFFNNCAISSDLPYIEGELLIRFAPKTNGIEITTEERNQILSSVNAGTVKKSLRLIPGLSIVKLSANLTVANAMQKLQGKGEILYVEPNYKIKLRSIEPNDEFFSNQWALHNTGGQYHTDDADIDANEACDKVTHSNIIVAVIDSGVDYTHPDLAANMCFNEAKCLNSAGFFLS